jgi:hypothetical protein
MVAIYGPNGVPLAYTATASRKVARRAFATEHGTPWGHLWALGYRVRFVHREGR